MCVSVSVCVCVCLCVSVRVCACLVSRESSRKLGESLVSSEFEASRNYAEFGRARGSQVDQELI